MRSVAFGVVVAVVSYLPTVLLPRTAAAQSLKVHVTIPNLAKPSELDFEGGECERTGDTMVCTFQQVLLRHVKDTDMCEIITNRYDATFTRQTPMRWVSNEGPQGICG